MLEKELINLIDTVINRKTETPNIELKAAKNGKPEKLYDSLSSFSNTKGEDELRIKERISKDSFDTIQLDGFLAKAVTVKPNLINIPKDSLMNLSGFTDENGYPTICGLMLFGKYPQIISPNLDIVAVKNSGTEYAKENDDGIRFIDNKRLDGTIPQMLNSALQFIQNNMKRSTIVDANGQRKDVSEYPVKALREIILNALIHRDYSYLTENDPIRIEMYSDRIEISNPGGLYGRLTLDDLGKAKADVRNPFIASALEILETTENRYSGIPTIRAEMEKAGLMPPRFDDVRGTFKVTLYNSKQTDIINSDFVDKIKEFCRKPRSKEILAKEFGYDEKHPAYFMKSLIKPLIDQGILALTIPEKPKSKNQRIITAD